MTSLNIQKMNGFAFWRHTKFEICKWIHILLNVFRYQYNFCGWSYTIGMCIRYQNYYQIFSEKTGEFQKIRSFLLKFAPPPTMPALFRKIGHSVTQLCGARS